MMPGDDDGADDGNDDDVYASPKLMDCQEILGKWLTRRCREIPGKSLTRRCRTHIKVVLHTEIQNVYVKCELLR